jgi:hypothetical protein
MYNIDNRLVATTPPFGGSVVCQNTSKRGRISPPHGRVSGTTSLNTSIELTDDAGAGSHRVAGQELPDWHQDVYQWISRQLRPVVGTVDVHVHGGSLLLAGVLPELNHVELSEGLTDVRTFPPAYDTPANLFREHVGRHYTACRRA